MIRLSKINDGFVNNSIVFINEKKFRFMDFIKSLFRTGDRLSHEEVKAIEGYMAGNPKYTETISFEDASKKWLADD